MLACEAVVETATAVTIQRTIERATGELCPCKNGHACPIQFQLGTGSPRGDLVSVDGTLVA